MSFTWLLAVSLLLVTVPREADACSCGGNRDPEDACKRSAAVFEGKIVKVTRGGANTSLTATFAVTRRWKGTIKARVNVTTESDDARCGLSFAKGEEWMIYAHSGADGLSAGLCSRSRPKAETVEDREVLGPGLPPVKAGEPTPSDDASVSECISSPGLEAPPVKTAVQVPEDPPAPPAEASTAPPAEASAAPPAEASTAPLPTARPGGCSVTAPAGGSLLVGSLLVLRRRRR